jgi:hypothetical protein
MCESAGIRLDDLLPTWRTIAASKPDRQHQRRHVRSSQILRGRPNESEAGSSPERDLALRGVDGRSAA